MVRWLRVVLCSVALAGCGGGDDSGDDDDGTPDAGDPIDIDGGIGGEPDAMVSTAECNPVSQTGCAAGEKCSSIRDMPTSCQAAGTVTGGGPCTVPEGGGPDDCEAGFIC